VTNRAASPPSLLLAVLAAALLAASARADTPPPATTTTDTTATATAVVPAGIVLGGVPIGGLAPDAAAQAVVQAFGRPVTLRIGGTTVSVTPGLLGVSVPAETAVAKALTAPPGTRLGLRAGMDRSLVQAFVAKLAARFDRNPVDSRLVLRAFKPVVTASVPGRRIEQGAAALAIADELEHGTRAPIELQAKVLAPKVTEDTIGPVIVIRRGSNLLTLYNGMRTVRRFAVATGQKVYPTPLGRFRIVVKWKNPWWYPPASPWAKGDKPTPPGPNNPLGTRWMGISAPGVGIHGTPQDGSIGYSLSHGCVRMHIRQAEWLFDHVNVGTPVYIVAG